MTQLSMEVEKQLYRFLAGYHLNVEKKPLNRSRNTQISFGRKQKFIQQYKIRIFISGEKRSLLDLRREVLDLEREGQKKTTKEKEKKGTRI